MTILTVAFVAHLAATWGTVLSDTFAVHVSDFFGLVTTVILVSLSEKKSKAFFSLSYMS